jgi:hypothetical protein
MGDQYEYIGTFVDDLTIWSKNPKVIFDTIMKRYGIKNLGEPEY